MFPEHPGDLGIAPRTAPFPVVTSAPLEPVEVLQRILARAQAHSELQPPTVPGMRVELAGVALGVHGNGWTDVDGHEYADPYQTDVRDRYEDDLVDRPPRDGYATYLLDDTLE
jgi:hypothetical protein